MSSRADQLVEAGQWLRTSGDLEGARRLFEQALRVEPAHARARSLLRAIGAGAAPVAAELTENATSAWDSRSNPGVHIATIHPETGSALDLVATPASAAPTDETAEEVRTLLDGARDLLELDDHSGAMELIAKALELSPNDPEGRALRVESEAVLRSMFESKLGSLQAVPQVALKEDEIIWLNLDHRAGFVLAQIDGTVSFEDIFAVSGMSRLDTARILAQLVEEGVITAGS